MKFAVDIDLDAAVLFSIDFEAMELFLSVLPTGLFCAVLFAVLAHHQEGTCACTPARDAALHACVLLILERVVEADEVVLVLESEDDARVVVVLILDFGT